MFGTQSVTPWSLGTTPSATSHDDVVRLLVAHAPIELALDCDGSPDADGIQAINRLIDELPDGVSLMIAGRSRTDLDVGRLVARGMASLCDADRLAFDAAEVRHLAEACKVSFDDIDVRRMLEASDGWPLVVSGAIRKAAEDGCSLSIAVENWRNRHGHLFTEFVTAALEHTPPADSEVVRQLMSGATVRDQQQLWALEMGGLFVIHDSNGYRALKALSKVRTHARAQSRSRATSLRFKCACFAGFVPRSMSDPSSGFAVAISRFLSSSHSIAAAA